MTCVCKEYEGKVKNSTGAILQLKMKIYLAHNKKIVI